MKKPQKNDGSKASIEKDQAYWENEVAYYDNALDGMTTAFGILNFMRAKALEELKKFSPDREEI